MTLPGTPGVEARAASSTAEPGVGAAAGTPAAALPVAADFPAMAAPPEPVPPPAFQTWSASPPSQRPPGSTGAGAAVDTVVAASGGGRAAERLGCEEGPAQDVSATAAATRARAARFFMPDGTAAAPPRFPGSSRPPGCDPAETDKFGGNRVPIACK